MTLAGMQERMEELHRISGIGFREMVKGIDGRTPKWRARVSGTTEFKASDLQKLLRIWPTLNLDWLITGRGEPFLKKRTGGYYREGRWIGTEPND